MPGRGVPRVPGVPAPFVAPVLMLATSKLPPVSRVSSLLVFITSPECEGSS